MSQPCSSPIKLYEAFKVIHYRKHPFLLFKNSYQSSLCTLLCLCCASRASLSRILRVCDQGALRPRGDLTVPSSSPSGLLMARPSIEDTGFRFALACGIRGAPWVARGSFMSEGSSLAGTAFVSIIVTVVGDSTGLLTSADDLSIVARKPAARRRCRSRAPQMVRCIRQKCRVYQDISLYPQRV